MLCVDTLGAGLMSAGPAFDSAGCCGAATGPVQTGPVYMLPAGARGRGIRVSLSVYVNGFDKYAVIAPDKVFCKACGYINLKNVILQQVNETSFQLLPRDCDGSSLTFCVSSPKELNQWMDTLGLDNPTEFPTSILSSSPPRSKLNSSPTSRSSRRASRLSLPSLQEEDQLSEESEEE